MHETDTGRSFPIREATDEQLAKHLAAANQQHGQLVQKALKMIGEATNAAKAAACIAYEIDRRARTIAIVTDLSQIHGLRRQ